MSQQAMDAIQAKIAEQASKVGPVVAPDVEVKAEEDSRKPGFYVSGHPYIFKEADFRLAPDAFGQYHPSNAKEKAVLVYQASQGRVEEVKG